ncbi:MAG: dockerin type I repeat-containing protein, partial [Lentisphaeria bacterium]|nr:dockerin type I repeat-containing protein [Lentisphaeria bacterium]
MIVRYILCLFLLGGGLLADPLRGDVNADGVLNIADRVLLGAMLGGSEPATESADLDGDGALTSADAGILADLLLGQPVYEPLGTAVLPTDGSAVAVGDLELAGAAGTFAAPVDIQVASAWRSLGYDDPDQSAVFRLDGVPYHETGGLVVSLPPSARRREGGTVMILFGEEVAAPSNGLGYNIATRALPATLVGGRYVVELPPLPPPPADREDELPDTARIYLQRVDSLVQDTYEGVAGRAGLTLDLVSPSTTTPEQKQRVVDALALAANTISGLGFDLTKRTSPVKIEVKKLDQGTCGFYQPSMVFLDWTSIDINVSLVTDPAQATTLRRTLIHEYFHMVQATYDPRSAFVQAKYNAPQLWIDEAASVWIEKFASGGSTSDYMESNAGEMMKGIHAETSGIAFRNAASRTRAQDHGYGMSMMFQYMF